MIKKVYEADLLVCPRCSGPLKIISLIGDGPVIEKILRHLRLWHQPERSPPHPAQYHLSHIFVVAGADFSKDPAALAAFRDKTPTAEQ